MAFIATFFKKNTGTHYKASHDCCGMGTWYHQEFSMKFASRITHVPQKVNYRVKLFAFERCCSTLKTMASLLSIVTTLLLQYLSYSMFSFYFKGAYLSHFSIATALLGSWQVMCVLCRWAVNKGRKPWAMSLGLLTACGISLFNKAWGVPFSPFQVCLSMKRNLLAEVLSGLLMWFDNLGSALILLGLIAVHPWKEIHLPLFKEWGFWWLAWFLKVEVCMVFKCSFGLSCTTGWNFELLQSLKLKYMLIFITALLVRLVWVGTEGDEKECFSGEDILWDSCMVLDEL